MYCLVIDLLFKPNDACLGVSNCDRASGLAMISNRDWTIFLFVLFCFDCFGLC